MELQERVEELRKNGIGLAAISYDSPEILADFARRRGITFPLLSDPGSEIIRRYGLLNQEIEPAHRVYGIPYPGTFVVDASGTVTARSFEDAYQERRTLASLLVKTGGKTGGPATVSSTADLEVAAWTSNAVVAPGHRFSLVLDVTPKQGHHVYAPGNSGYIPVALTLDPQPSVRIHPTEFPASEEYYFKPLNERVRVYMKPFRLLQDVTIEASDQAQAALKKVDSLTIRGRLDYQACDDRVCYPPATVPVSWTIRLKPLDRERAAPK